MVAESDRRRMLERKALRMPLHGGKAQLRIARFQRFDHAHRASSRDLQRRRDPFRICCLMVCAVDLAYTSQGSRHACSRKEMDIMRRVSRIALTMPLFFFRHHRRHVLNQPAPQRDVEHLHPSADAKHRTSPRHKLVHEAIFLEVPRGVYVRGFWMALTRGIPFWSDIATAGQEQRIELQTGCRRIISRINKDRRRATRSDPTVVSCSRRTILGIGHQPAHNGHLSESHHRRNSGQEPTSALEQQSRLKRFSVERRCGVQYIYKRVPKPRRERVRLEAQPQPERVQQQI